GHYTGIALGEVDNGLDIGKADTNAQHLLYAALMGSINCRIQIAAVGIQFESVEMAVRVNQHESGLLKNKKARNCLACCRAKAAQVITSDYMVWVGLSEVSDPAR